MNQIAKTAAEEVYADLDNLPDGFSDIRRQAAKSVAASGLPNRRIEEWKWTDLRRIVDQAYPPAIGGKVATDTLDRLLAMSPFGDIAGSRLVFVNGVYDDSRSSLPVNITISTLAQSDKLPDSLPESLNASLRDGDVIDALNLAYASDGAIITVGKDCKINQPLELVFLTAPDQPATITTRNAIVLEEGAELTVFELHAGHDEAYVTNNVAEITIGDKACLNRVRLQEDGANAIHLSNIAVTLGMDAELRDFTFTLGGKTVRNQGFVTFNGENSSANMSGSYMIADKQHVDTTLVIDHAVPACQSRELYKCVMDENARGIFQGKVIVARDAQKTDGQQSANALLLSEGAEFDAKPELEIYADDVWCGHGATSGDLDENQLFYLKARGIPESKAKALLIAAFAAAAFEEIENEAVRDAFNALAQGWLDRRGGS